MKSGSKVKAWFEKLIKDLRAILDKAYNILKGQKSWEQMELIRNNKQTLDMIADYYFEGMEGTKGKAANEDGKVSFSPRLDPDFGSSVDIEKNYRAVANMQPVAKVKGTEFAKGEVDLITQVSNFFEEIGGEVISPDLGRIILDRNGVKDDIAHGIGRNKAAAFVAVPDVIKKGKILDVQYNWKGRGYDTVIVAAPVVFSGQNAIEGVILRKKSINDDFYLHEIKIEGVSTFKTGANKIGAPSADTPSVISILQKVFDYKEKSDGNVKLSAKDINADIREVNPMEITPPNRVTSSSKYHYLINEFENNGYNGRNVVLVENGNDGYQALTGSHRILAAREAGVDVPSVVIPMSEEIQPLLDATGDEERARIADELYEDGIIPKEARDLLVREDELNFENLGKPLDKQARFSMKDTVEETRDLIAVHNLNGDQLAHNDKPIVAAFQSTLPARGSDKKRHSVCSGNGGFQSTLPTGEQRTNLVPLSNLQGISIHAPHEGERQRKSAFICSISANLLNIIHCGTVTRAVSRRRIALFRLFSVRRSGVFMYAYASH